MKYRTLVKDGAPISVLGFGCMRFPTRNGTIDEKRTKEQFSLAFEQGVNYFDTAYLYHHGKSEEILGRWIKERDIRKQIYIADKLPQFLIRKKEQMEEYFVTQLKRLQTEYIDYYLVHMIDSKKRWEQLKEWGIISFLEEKKKQGKIHHIGFSYHGPERDFLEIIKDYSWEFCQIQYNYLDENYQAGKKGLQCAYELGLGVIVMEPLRGGKLATGLPEEVIRIFKGFDSERTPAEWALKWIWNHKEVGLLLSGMNREEQIWENTALAEESPPYHMSNEELTIVRQAKQHYRKLMKVPCTGCNYCMPCPFGVEIPATFSDYNNQSFFGGIMPQMQYIGRKVGFFGERKSSATHCTQCGECEKHCPQNIPIRKVLKEAHQKLNNLPLTWGLTIATKVLRKNK